ncbi:hypothetical protein TNCV_2944001 [Trichonephila clavipes]|nr:hypothetical protein TNCV_2944001 [Trichonephila clavipes]
MILGYRKKRKQPLCITVHISPELLEVNLWEQTKNTTSYQQPSPPVLKLPHHLSNHTIVPDPFPGYLNQLKHPAVKDTFDILEESITTYRHPPSTDASRLPP